MASSIVSGPFSVAWGSNPILDVTELTLNYDVEDNSYQTIQGNTYHIEGAIDANIEIQLLKSDVEALRVIFPQYYVAQGQTLSTGETVTAEEGAIDIVAASCDTQDTRYPLDVVSCNGTTLRLTNTKTALVGVDIQDNSVLTVTVRFSGEAAGKGVLQMFASGGITPVES